MQDPSAYSVGSGQYLQAPYNTQFPNPLLAAGANGGPLYYANAPPEAQFFATHDDIAAGNLLANFDHLHGNHALNRHSGAAIPQPLDDDWTLDILDDEASLPDSDDDVPDVRSGLVPNWTTNATDAKIFSAFAQNDNVLAYMETPYSSESWASGLNTIYMHFINVTGPGISIFEGDISCAADRTRAGTADGSGHSLWSCKCLLQRLQGGSSKEAC